MIAMHQAAIQDVAKAASVVRLPLVPGGSYAIYSQRVRLTTAGAKHADPRDATAASLAWAELLGDIRRWRRLRDGWDGPGSIPIAAAVLARGEQFLWWARANDLTCPESYVAADGEIGYRWSKGGRVASVAFPQDGFIVAYAERPSGFPLEVEEPARPMMNYRELTDTLGRHF